MGSKILVLGAGLVARPLIQYLLNTPEFQVRVASRTVSKAQALVGNSPNGEAYALDVADSAALEKAVKESSLVVSLLPYVHHVAVANLCIAHKKHLVTTSYVSDAMRALDGPARKAGVIFLNEIGLD
ncbi:MAG: saccharopine dehydrogenase NADP-binding domain-containing protein, partial [Planctomycetota bacterium]|nr:saccharopine dehydrogenase NADP-binding domain-containing protein [Planctomycetota bacterium]